MKENENKIAGYIFSDVHEYKEARREAETVDYIRSKTDLKDLNKVLKLYHKLVERKTLKTVVGFAFLKELQDRILKEGIINSDNMPCIPIDKNDKHLRAFLNSMENGHEQKQVAMLEEYRIRYRNSRIINVFLIVIIIAMIVISVWSDRNIFSNFENEILDKYSVWEEELNAREQLLEKEAEALQSID